MVAKRLVLGLLLVGAAALPLSAAEPEKPPPSENPSSGKDSLLAESLGDGFRLLAASPSGLLAEIAEASPGAGPAAGCAAAADEPWFHGLLRQAHVWLSGGTCGEGLSPSLSLPAQGHPRPLALYDHPAVEQYLRMYLKVNGAAFERGLRRSGRYLPMIHRIFAEEGIPGELAYLPAVESNFNPRALSPVRATGLWQFMAATAMRFGLHLRWPWYDERLDPERSTRAAARLLAYLYDRYGSWELALAAYNAGEGKVNKAILQARRTGVRINYWNLELPLQTEAYVPAFLAMARLYAAPQEHGYGDVEREPPEVIETLFLDAPTSLAEIAHRLKMPLPELVQLNPAWRRGYIPARYRSSVRLRLPVGMGAKLLASLATEEVSPPPWLTHTVAPRETLSEIAMIYGVSIADILEVNPINNRHFLAVGQRLIIPLMADARPPAPHQNATAAQPTPPARQVAPEQTVSPPAAPPNTTLRYHRVSEGDSLHSISRRYGVSVGDLNRWNPSLPQPLRASQHMVVFLPEPPEPPAVALDAPSS